MHELACWLRLVDAKNCSLNCLQKIDAKNCSLERENEFICLGISSGFAIDENGDDVTSETTSPTSTMSVPRRNKKGGAPNSSTLNKFTKLISSRSQSQEKQLSEIPADQELASQATGSRKNSDNFDSVSSERSFVIKLFSWVLWIACWVDNGRISIIFDIREITKKFIRFYLLSYLTKICLLNTSCIINNWVANWQKATRRHKALSPMY